MTTILMCPPDFYGIHYEINPWMNLSVGVNHPAAVSQWETLFTTLKSCGAKLTCMPPQQGWPDLVFTANGGLCLGNRQIVLPHFKYPERQGEEPYFKEWFEAAGFTLVNTVTQDSPYFEGAGDALFAGDLLFVGYGFRSDKHYFETVPYFQQDKLVYCELIDPYFYHIDTCFCPLSDSLAMWYPPAFSAESQTAMKKNIELIAVTEAEAKQFACNAVVINKHVVLPTGTPLLSAVLSKHGYTPHPIPMHEYIKAGGACKCLTLALD